MRLLLLLLLIAVTQAAAQDGYGSTSIYDRVVQLPKGKHFFVILPNEKWESQKWKDSVYRFDSFQTGKLIMANGFVPSHRPMLNYNLMIEAMDIKQPTGEIVTMRRSPTIVAVYVGDTKFVYNPSFGFLEIILDGKVSVGKRTYMKSIYELSNGNRYEQHASTDIRLSLAKTTRYYWPEEQYFILSEDSKAFRSGSTVLRHLLPKHKHAIKSFAKKNHIDYKKKDDILKIVAYANEEAGKETGN
jgi:hypothetical protein